MKSVKFNEVFKIVNPEYVYLKLIPNNSIRNQSSYKIARTIVSLYKGMFRRIQIDERKVLKVFSKEFMMGTKFSYRSFEKIGYFIYMEKKKIEFYFIVPKQYQDLIEEKLSDVWGGITIEEAECLPVFSDKAEKYQMTYDKEDALSLKVDQRDNDLLRSNLNVTNVMDENDKVGLFYNFIPTTQHGWKAKYNYTIEKVNNYQPVDRDKSKGSYIFKYGMTLLTSLLNEIFNAITDKKHVEEKETMFTMLLKKMTKQNELLPATTKKENATIIKTQILVISDSDDSMKRYNNLKSLSQSFETISGDNKLVAKKYRKKFDPTKYMIDGASINFMSDIECNNLISLAGRDILEEFDFMEKVETKETQVPEDLREGKFCIGSNTFRGNKQNAYLSSDKEFQYLALVPIGPNRSGKSTLIGNLGKDAINNNECVINFDFIGNCELSNEMSSLFPPERTLDIICDDGNQLQGLGYNEVPKVDDPFKHYANTKLQTSQLLTLVNSINDGGQPLTTRMERYLQGAANVVFISTGSINDVFQVLMDHNIRHDFISKVPSEQLEDLKESMDSLRELDDTNNDGEITGTRYSRIDGIIDRLNKLKANPYMEKMLKKDSSNNVNLVDEFQKSQLINIRIPEDMFSTDGEKDVYTTYWLTKIWLALQIRKSKFKEDRDKMKKVNLFVDELYQVKNTEKFLATKLSRLPKFNIKPIISCHYLNQLVHLREELRSASASYMLIAGCDKDNFKEFKSELYPYIEEDLLNLKRFHSLNLIKNNTGYGKFITLMPPHITGK